MIPLIDKPAVLSEAQMYELIDVLPDFLVASFPRCNVCGLPQIILGVPFEPFLKLRPGWPECRLCNRRHGRADKRRRNHPEAAK